VPTTLDYVDLRPDLVVEMMARYRDLQSTLPFNGWWRNPIAAVFTVKGCAYECVTCGSSHTTCTHLTKRQRPVFRSPSSLVANVEAFARLTRGPIALIGDLRQAGPGHASEVLERLRGTGIRNEIIIELFSVPPLEFLREIDRSVPHWSIEFSPESHDQAVRDAQEGEADYTTEAMEEMLREALRLRCERLDVFFMIGLPGQTLESVRRTVDYCEHLFQLGDQRLSCFISPMGPFIDPGSRGFEEPERFGYRLFARTLEEHRRLLVQPTWEHILNYETKWMTRRELVDATYDAAARLNELKVKYGRVSRRQGRRVATGIAAASALRARLESGLANGGDPAADAALRGEIARFSMSTVCDKRELFWRRRPANFRLAEVMRIMGRHLAAGRRR
jgi:B12-binding domain/radical SAM domain protein